MKHIPLVTAGMFLGLLLFLSQGAFVLILTLCVGGVWLYRRDAEGTGFVMILFLSAFAVRIILLLAANVLLVSSGKILSYPGYPGWTPNLIGDSAYYTLRGYWMALDWKGVDLSDNVLRSAYNPLYGWHGYTYIVAVFNYLFGFSPVSSKMLACALGPLSAVLAFLVMREYFSEKVAKLSGIFVAFFPSTLLWSITNLKESYLGFVTLFILWSFIMFMRGKRRIMFLAFMVTGLLLQSTIRLTVMPVTLASLFIGFFIAASRPRFFIKLFACFVFFAAAMLLSGKLDIGGADSFIRGRICRAIAVHQATALVEEASNYRILDDKYYIINPDFKPGEDPDPYWYLYRTQDLGYPGYLRALVRGWLHFLFEPFPWKIDTGLKLAAYPQMILWYLLAPFAALGSFILLRYRWREYLVLPVYFMLMTSVCALTMANIGTALRFRDMVSAVYLMFAAVGVAKAARWRVLKTTNAGE